MDIIYFSHTFNRFLWYTYTDIQLLWFQRRIQIKNVYGWLAGTSDSLKAFLSGYVHRFCTQEPISLLYGV